MTTTLARANGKPGSSLAEFRSAQRGDRSADPAVTAFWRYMTHPEAGNPWSVLDEAERRVLSKATNAAGGFIVPQDFADLIISASRPDVAVGAVARPLLTSDGTALPIPTVPSHGSGGWVAENAAQVDSDDAFSQQTFGAYKSHSKTIISEELDTDALDAFDEYLATELGRRLTTIQETAFGVGDGAGKPLGITDAASGFPVVQAPAGNATNLRWADYVAVLAALPAAYRANASWLLSPGAMTNLAALTDSAGSPIWRTDGPELRLLGLPVRIAAGMAPPAASAKTAAVGDWSQAYGVRRMRGLAVQRLDELHALNGQIGFKLIERVDGRPLLTDAARILQHSAT